MERERDRQSKRCLIVQILLLGSGLYSSSVAKSFDSMPISQFLLLMCVYKSCAVFYVQTLFIIYYMPEAVCSIQVSSELCSEGWSLLPEPQVESIIRSSLSG